MLQVTHLIDNLALLGSGELLSHVDGLVGHDARDERGSDALG
jgi:hypothetical protein